MIRNLAACLAAPFLASASIPDAITVTHHPSVVQVLCDQGRGTAFRWRGNAVISVMHVVGLSNCSINGVPIEVALKDEEQDFAILRLPSSVPGIPVNCEGFKSGERYYAVGYARGRPYQRMIAVQGSEAATRVYGAKGFSVLVGAEYFIPGMSGGPVLNADGEAVGTVNAFNPFLGISYSTQLKDTAICSSPAFN
jgi:hypothetical protein